MGELHYPRWKVVMRKITANYLQDGNKHAIYVARPSANIGTTKWYYNTTVGTVVPGEINEAVNLRLRMYMLSSIGTADYIWISSVKEVDVVSGLPQQPFIYWQDVGNSLWRYNEIGDRQRLNEPGIYVGAGGELGFMIQWLEPDTNDDFICYLPFFIEEHDTP